MKTFEMVALAEQNGKTYKSKYGTYSKKTGFKLTENFLCIPNNVSEMIDNLLTKDCWSIVEEKKKMTKEDIEKALGYKIEITDYEPKTVKAVLNDSSLSELIRQIFEE